MTKHEVSRPSGEGALAVTCGSKAQEQRVIEGQAGDRKGKKKNSYYCTYTKATTVRTGIFNRGILRSIDPVGKTKRLSRDSRQTKKQKGNKEKKKSKKHKMEETPQPTKADHSSGTILSSSNANPPQITKTRTTDDDLLAWLLYGVCFLDWLHTYPASRQRGLCSALLDWRRHFLALS